MSGEREPIIPPPQSSPETPSSSSNGADYQDSRQSLQSRLCQLMFVGLVVVLVIITIGLSIYKAVHVDQNGFIYFMLGLNVTGLGLLEIIMILCVHRGHLPSGKTWFLYFVGGAVVLESIFTNIALFQ